jgi:predicted nucleic acid-binding protein
MQYVDSSALVKRYVEEPDSGQSNRLLDADQDWLTAAISEVEVRRVLAMRLEGPALADARADFLRDWERTAVVALDATTLGQAAALAEATRIRSLDAIHLAALTRAGSRSTRMVTFDIRLAAAARSLGWAVVGA